jgi:hypothetical protein
MLLPETIDDYVEADNPVLFIEAFVEGLDLKVAGFERVEGKATGHPGYAPGDLLSSISKVTSTEFVRAGGLTLSAIVISRSSGCCGP